MMMNSVINDSNLIHKSNASFTSQRLMGFAEKLKAAHDNQKHQRQEIVM